MRWQAPGFGAEHECIARLIANLIVMLRAFGGYRVDAVSRECFPATFPVVVQRVVDPGTVIHAGALELFIRQ